MYIRLYPKDYDITLDDVYDIASISNGGKSGKIRRHKNHVDSYKKRGSVNKKRVKSMKKKRS
jgi:hypothetical protein